MNIPIRSSRFVTGMTLLELMVVVALVAIIATVAVPGFNNLLQQHRTSSQAMQLFHSIQFARTEAVRLNTPIRLSAHNNGWCVHSGDSCTENSALREYANASQLQASTMSNMTFDGRGRRTAPNSANLQVRFQGSDCQGNQANLVSVNPLGYPTVSKVSCL